MKTCTKCAVEKPATREFFSWEHRYEAWRAQCKQCLAAYKSRYFKDRRIREPDFYSKISERDMWGAGTYDALTALQGEACAICNAPRQSRRRLDIDHCHDTGLIRGLLCNRCNIQLSQMALLGDVATLAYLADPPCISLGLRSRSNA